MKTPPDETTITLWIDGTLEGDDLQRMEAYAAEHPELLSERDAIRTMTSAIQENIPASMEPPYADFFNQRILRHLDEQPSTHSSAPSSAMKHKRSIWQRFTVPAAVAAMAACFYMGTRVGTHVDEPTLRNASTIADVTSVYTPDVAVRADVINAKQADATVILLAGLEDIPDDLEIVQLPATPANSAMMVNTGNSY